MKHYAMIAAALVAGVLLFTECASMRIPYRRLPAKAKAFIETYFPAERCVYAERDRDDGRREYEVSSPTARRSTSTQRATGRKWSANTRSCQQASSRRLLPKTSHGAFPADVLPRPSGRRADTRSRRKAARRRSTPRTEPSSAWSTIDTRTYSVSVRSGAGRRGATLKSPAGTGADSCVIAKPSNNTDTLCQLCFLHPSSASTSTASGK